MNFKKEQFIFKGLNAIVVIPNNANGKVIWKTEYFNAFESAELELLQKGYTRIHLTVEDKYASPKTMRLMHAFQLFVTEKYNLNKKANLFGFSRGGLLAFTYSLYYSEYVEKLYLDAPVLDVKTWPPKGSDGQKSLFENYYLNEQTFELFKGDPINNLQEFFELNIPLLVIAGAKDSVVPFDKNAGTLLNYAKTNGYKVEQIIKPLCDHHPHGLLDNAPIIEFIEN